MKPLKGPILLKTKKETLWILHSEYMTMGSFSDMKLILLQTKNMSLMNIRHIIFRKEPKDGCSNTIPGYEKFFPVSTDGKLPDRPKVNSWGYPGLVELQDSVFMLITEANIRRGHCGSLLFNGDNNDRYQVKLADKKSGR